MRRKSYLSLKQGFTPIIAIVAVVVLALIIGGFFLFKQFTSPKVEPVTYDEFPIWLLRDGDVAVYQELTIDKDGVEKNIVVTNLGKEDQENVKVYISFSKAFAQHASDLTFSEEVEIVEDDPVVLWSVSEDTPDPTVTELITFLPKLAYAVLAVTYDIAGDVAINNLTDTCQTQDAKAWIAEHSYASDPGVIYRLWSIC